MAFERGDLVTAERVLEQSLSMSEDVRPAFALVSQLSLSRVWLADGRVGEALSGVERARAFLRPDSTSPLLSLCHALEGRIAIEIGDLDRATRCAQSLQPGTEHPCFRLGSSSPEASQIAPTTPSLDARRQRCASASTSRCFAPGSRTSGSLTPQIRCSRRRSPSRRSKASSWPSPTTSSNSDRASRCFYGQDASRTTSRPCSIASNATRPSRTRTAAPSGPLSSRELTVVRYLASRLTYKEIAAELFVSTNTLKTHVKRIYQKLGVSSRTEAVTEARRLGLF